jgi:hypothetical protein
MPIATDSGYLPDWLAALIGQGSMGTNVPSGLFSDTAASPSPNVGLLSNSPLFTGVRPDAPAFRDGNAPNGPLPDPAATFSFMSPNPPWGGAGPSNSYPSMAFPQDPGPMNIGPGGAAPSFTGVNPTAPAFQGGDAYPQGGSIGPRDFAPATTSSTYSANPYGNLAIPDRPDVPLPPRRPNDLTSFQAQAPEDPRDINTPPPGRPNAHVIGTEASGAPEVTAQKSQGLGDYLGKAADLIGGIYGAGGPGDALIALGLSNRTNGASIQALNAGILNRSKQAELALKQAEANDKIKAIAGNVALVKRLYPNLSDAETSAFARNPEMMKQIGQIAAPMEQWSTPYKDENDNLAMRHLRTGETRVIVKAPDPQLVDLATGKLGPNGQQEFIKTWVGKGEGGAAIPAAASVGAPFTKQPEVSVNTAIDPVLEGAGKMFIDQAKTAQSSADQVRSIHDARRALDSPGGVITGFKANDRLALKQLAEMFGADSRGVENTQTFNAAMKPVIMASLGGSLGTGISNADRDFLQRASGADATLDEKAIRRILDINEQLAREKIDRHNSNADEYIQANPTLAKVAPTLKVKMPGEYTPPATADSGKQPPANAKQAADGNYYIPDPNRPGKYLRWTP